MINHTPAWHRHYRAFRAAGSRPAEAARAATTECQWTAAEAAGLVRLTSDWDEYPDLSWLCSPDDFTRVDGADGHSHLRCTNPREHRNTCIDTWRTIDRDGVQAVFAQVATGDRWESADSLGGVIGYEWEDRTWWHGPDLKRAALNLLRERVRERIPADILALVGAA